MNSTSNEILDRMNAKPLSKVTPELAKAAMKLYANPNCKKCWGKGYQVVDQTQILCKGHDCTVDRMMADGEREKRLLEEMKNASVK